FGYSLKSFVNTLAAVGLHALLNARDNKRFAYQFIQRAYNYVPSIDALVEALVDFSESEWWQQEGANPLDKQEVRMILDSLALHPQNQHVVSLATRGPRFLIFPGVDRGIVLDYAAVLPILLSKCHFIKADFRPKGTLFERWLDRKLGSKGIVPWKRGELKGNDGTSREVDYSLIVNNILILIEARCVSKSFDFELGDLRALEFRKDKLVQALSDVDEKARWLSARRQGANYKVPDVVQFIVPLVISPFVEYIWTTSKNVWLTPEIPRVCTTDELGQLLDQLRTGTPLGEILSSPSCVYVS
ncbi:MAG: hypothetical protein QMD10_12745, partial [Desulfitobacteriaceae bacterium]|nr:hypothetical protein [Desulfitobacteriaceae bacterium]